MKSGDRILPSGLKVPIHHLFCWSHYGRQIQCGFFVFFVFFECVRILGDPVHSTPNRAKENGLRLDL